MEMHNRNQSDLLPYEKLAILGINRVKADSLPIEVKEKLMAGEVTPIMQQKSVRFVAIRKTGNTGYQPCKGGQLTHRSEGETNGR